MLICLMSFTLAYYPGEVLELENEMGIENLVYTIIDNSTKMPNINITMNSTIITIKFPQDMPPNDFKIVFLENQTNEIVKVVHSGGSSKVKYVDRNVTVIQPKFYDREVVREVELVKEVIKEEKDENKKWKLILIGIVAALIITIIALVIKLVVRREYD